MSAGAAVVVGMSAAAKSADYSPAVHHVERSIPRNFL